MGLNCTFWLLYCHMDALCTFIVDIILCISQICLKTRHYFSVGDISHFYLWGAFHFLCVPEQDDPETVKYEAMLDNIERLHPVVAGQVDAANKVVHEEGDMLRGRWK